MMRAGRVVPLLFALSASAAIASPRRSAHVIGDKAACPSPEALASAIAAALPDFMVTVARGEAGSFAVGYFDQGPRYHVFVAGRDREFSDPARRCAERARTAAVFVALTLQPPSLPDPPPPSPVSPLPPSPPSKAAPPPSPPPSPPVQSPAPVSIKEALPRSPEIQSPRPARKPLAIHFDLEGSGLFVLAPDGAASTPSSGGASLRAAFSLGHFGVALGASALAAATLHLAQGAARLQRVPFDLDLRASLRRGRWEGAVDLGFVLAVDSISGIGFSVDQGGTRLEPGVRAAVQVRSWFGRVAPFVAFEADVFPASHELDVDGRAAGATPRAWLGALVGLAVRIH